MKHWWTIASFSKKQRLLLLGGGVVIILIAFLVVFSLSQSGNNASRSLTPTLVLLSAPTKTPQIATALLSLKQETATSTTVVLDTGNRAATAVQLEVSFDPTVLRNIAVTQGTFFDKYYPFLRIDYQKGTLFFVLLIPPSGQPKQGKGTIATISYTFNQGAINPTTLQFLPKTKVTAAGLGYSILKQATGITIASSQ